jgi:hypothetical protein
MAFITGFFHLFFKDQKISVAGSYDADNPVARFFCCPCNDRETGSTNSSADQNAGPVFLYFTGSSQRTGNIAYRITGPE